MAIVIKSFQATNAADLTTAVNAYLAGLTNPKINGAVVVSEDDARTLGRTYRCILTTQTGGSAIATPWLLNLWEAINTSEIEASATAYVGANAGYFVSAIRLYTWYYNSGAAKQKCVGYAFSNSTAGASANWLPL